MSLLARLRAWLRRAPPPDGPVCPHCWRLTYRSGVSAHCPPCRTVWAPSWFAPGRGSYRCQLGDGDHEHVPLSAPARPEPG